MSSLNRGNPDFIRPKIELLKWDKSSSYWTYDAFNPPGSGPRLINLATEDVWAQTGKVDFVIEDSDKALPATVGNGNKFILSLSHNGTDWTPFLAGWIRGYGVNRKETGIREVVAEGYGNKIRAIERVSNFMRIARRQGDGFTPDLTDPAMKCSELLKSAWTSADTFPFGDVEPFTVAGVATVNETIASLRENFVELGEITNRLIDASGSNFDIDANDDIVFDYITNQHSGVTIKSTASLDVDNEAKTGYFMGPWDYKDEMKKSSGFANRLIGIGGSDFHMDIDFYTDAGQDEFHSVDRGMQWTAEAPRLSSLALKLSKVGSPTNAITGEIRHNKDATNKPDGEQIGTFAIIPSLVSTTATDVNRINVQMTDDRLQIDKKYWIVLLKNGSAGDHYRWHHDGGTSGTYATRPAGSWTTFTAAKRYAHRVYSSRRVLHEYSDIASRAKLGTVDKKVYAPFILERRAMDTLLSGLASITARQRRSYAVNKILAPTTILHAGRLVTLIDTLEGINQNAIIQRIGYSFNTNENGMGTRFATLGLTAFV